MSYVLVTADFPGVNAEQREKVYRCLEQKMWHKVRELGRDISTVWWASFNKEVSEEDAVRITISDFESCAGPYCPPKLVVHWGISKPTLHGLV